MNKIISRIAIALASFAMVIGGVSTVAAHNKEQAKPAYADGNNVVATLNTTNIVNYGKGEWIREDWKVSWGGSHHCGFDYNEWKTIEEQGYSKYVDGVAVTADSYGFVVASRKQFSYVGGFDFLSSYENRNSKLYLTYSTDGESYSLVPFTSGEQGTGVRNDDVTLSFDFDSIRRAYYAIIVVSTYSTIPSQASFQFDFVSHFYEKIDPNAERITVDGPHEVYVDEEIELTATLYNFNPSEINWVSSDPSIISITSNGNTAIVSGIKKGSVSITASANGSNGLVYIDPFMINVKQFSVSVYSTFITMSPNSSYAFNVGYEDYVGPMTIDIDLLDGNLIDVVADDYDSHCSVIIDTNSIGGVKTSFDLIIKDNVSETISHEATITFQVTILAKPLLGERLNNIPNSKTPVYLGLSDGSCFAAINDWGELIGVNDIEDAHVFYVEDCWEEDTSYIYADSSCDSGYAVCEGYGNFVVNNFPTCFSIYASNDEHLAYSGMVIDEYQEKYMFYDKDSNTICLEYIDGIEYKESEDLVSPSNVFYFYRANEIGEGIYPNKTSIDLIEGESTSLDASLVFVNDVEYEIISGASCIDSVAIANITNYRKTSITITASDTRGTAVIRVKDANDDSVYTDITVRVKVDAETEVGNISTQTSLAYHYSKDELGNFTYSNASIRFGGKINKDLWNEIDEDYDIAGFGVMITNRVVQSLNPAAQNYLIKQHVNDAVPAESATDLSTQLVDHYMSISEMAVPPESGDDYVWNLMQSITINNAFDALREYTAAAYIKLSNDDYLFFGQVTTSAYELANDYLNGEYDETSAGGSLKNIVDMVDNMLN